MRVTITLSLCLLSGSGTVLADSCLVDAGGTFKSTNIALLAPYTNITGFGLREINHFPRDIRNFAYNWIVLGRGGTATPGTNSLGRQIFNKYANQEIIAWLYNDYPHYDISVPLCNDHGQCATGTVTIEPNTVGVRFSQGWYVGTVTGIKQVTVRVDLPSGGVSKVTYLGNQVKTHQATSGFKLPVPYNTTPDTAKNGDCLNNLGQKRPPDSEMTPVDTGGSGGESGDDPYQHWWDEEEAYGGRVPELRCGTSSLSTGESTTVCGWFWF